MQQKKILFATLFAAAAVGAFVLYMRRRPRTFVHHPKPFSKTEGVAEMEFSI